ncbi:MAG TPA: BTAD domain-containing putative transcriptional regulator [Longimicrobium sp.]|jgi:DNA-binding SARP family transcriptional activator
MERDGRKFLQTLGHPVLRREDGSVVGGLLRYRKDLALLAYLAIEGARPHSRAWLAALLWGESTERLARHSLTQTLGRIARTAGRDALVVERESVRWTGAVQCDAVLLLGGGPPAGVDDELALYAGPFLEGFEAGFGSREFDEWAGRRRADLRNAALARLERLGAEAEATGDWDRALRLGERAVQIDPVCEQGRRRVMRALAARGERNRALRYYEEFAAWLKKEVGADPDPDTRALAERLRA